ncbi:hypothetical protein Nepgr_029851 [Nepenthes gracilis]|uniref:Uncharacterized protein n=1 Tax=Nepenthes gracilis TaxID=150966 RepID=A0AAD3TDA5_NEPGR|nr:hypothetical protein Nepgr_029851 [Nepenthes gracilis]
MASLVLLVQALMRIRHPPPGDAAEQAAEYGSEGAKANDRGYAGSSSTIFGKGDLLAETCKIADFFVWPSF